MRTRLPLATAVALVTGCASSPRYVYDPSEQAKREDAPGEVDGHAAAAYRVPKAAPRGEVQVAAVGIVELKSVAGRGRALHLRMVVHNGDRQMWTVDPSAQKVVIDLGPSERSRSMVCDGGGTALAVLLPGDRRTVDLFCPLSKEAFGLATMPSFRVEWRIERPGHVIATGTTSFDRHEVAKTRAPIAPADRRRIEDELEPSVVDDGMPQPGRAESSDWPTWRD